MLGDDVIVGKVPAIRRLADLHGATGAPVVAVMEVPREEIRHYGCVAGEAVEPGVWRVRDLVEKPAPDEAPSNLAIIGRYVLTAQMLDELAATPPDRGGEIQLTEGMRRYLARGPLFACTFPGRRYDAGNKADFLRATVELGLAHPELGESLRQLIDELARRP
jgi:UTP--glucose-1-phosphate uridylyltransferase